LGRTNATIITRVTIFFKVSSNQEHYEKIKELGNGTFSTVFLAERKADGKKVAMKVLNTRN
jgi:serine/threonine protein kinase